jgi:hypothetical protein
MYACHANGIFNAISSAIGKEDFIVMKSSSLRYALSRLTTRLIGMLWRNCR